MTECKSEGLVARAMESEYRAGRSPWEALVCNCSLRDRWGPF